VITHKYLERHITTVRELMQGKALKLVSDVDEAASFD
jgi:hypothetical protein